MTAHWRARIVPGLMLGVAAFVLSCPTVATADDAYKGKAIKIYIGSGPGGGYDLFGRLVARHIGAHIPGQPTVTPQNMPGAGSVVATNYIYNVAPKDGTAWGSGSPSLPLIEALETPGVRFKANQLNWLGRISSNINVTFSWHTTGVKTIADATKKEVLIAAISSTSPLTLQPKMMNATAGTKFKMIHGYADSNATLLAMERGEVGGTTASWATLRTQKPDWIRDKKVNILVQYDLKRIKELSDVPSAVETGVTDEDKKLQALYVSGADVGYSIYTAPGVPPAQLATLRKAFSEMLEDPKFIEDLKQLGSDLDPMSGTDLQAMIAETTVFPDSVRARAKAMSGAE
jgi:tripartite-type tricarboxylate transporter receptor subunit TctC